MSRLNLTDAQRATLSQNLAAGAEAVDALAVAVRGWIEEHGEAEAYFALRAALCTAPPVEVIATCIAAIARIARTEVPTV